nr:hypothetical protein [Candidatus Brachybacter algidus]
MVFSLPHFVLDVKITKRKQSISVNLRICGMVSGVAGVLGQNGVYKDNRKLFSAGFDYTLPMLLIFQTEVYHNGDVRLQIMREDIPISKRLRFGFMVNTDKEYMVDLGYIVNKNIGIRTHYDSDMGFGVGLAVNY